MVRDASLYMDASIGVERSPLCFLKGTQAVRTF